MTLTSAEVAKMQKHNADLVRENATLSRDNEELRRQVAAIKRAAIGNDELPDDFQSCTICAICKFNRGGGCGAKCSECVLGGMKLWQPPDA